MTNDEQRIADIEKRVRPTIGPTFNCSAGTETIEGRISKEDFDYLIHSITAWKLVAGHNGKLARLTPDENAAALEKALESTTADWLTALDEIDRLTGPKN